MSDERFQITARGEAIVESGLSVRHVHEIETGCRPGALCTRCRMDVGTSLMVLGRSQVADYEANPTLEAKGALAEWALDNLRQMLDSLEALGAWRHRPAAGWMVGQPTTQGWNLVRMYGAPERAWAGAEQDLANALEEDGPGSGWQLLEVREVA